MIAIESLWGAEFNIPDTKETAKKIKAKKEKAKKEPLSIEKVVKSKSISIEEKLPLIEKEVNRVLGTYASDTVLIKSKEELVKYIDASIKNGVISIDTETNNSLDPLTCKIMGACIYTPGQKNAYIPINHVDTYTKEHLNWQVTEQDIKEQFDRLVNTKIIMHNSKFDCEVIKCTCDCDLNVYWDTQTGSRILNENESAKLKDQYRTKIDSNQEKYDIEKLFNGVEYAVVNPELFALYAATDAYITYKLFEYQYKEFTKPGNERLFSLFMDVEMKVIPVLTAMEMNGIAIDEEYSKRLSIKYHKKLEDVTSLLDAELLRLQPEIDKWKLSDKAHEKTIDKNGKVSPKEKIQQLSDPITLTSPTQLAILLYDILGAKVTDKKNPRGTGEEVLEALKKDIPICSILLEQRTILKMLSAFIDTLPEQRSKRDNKIHAHFNALGADTGRQSCSDPNLQQIPSHNNEIRLLFTADEGKTLVGADFSQQEPRLLAAYSKDSKMINSYKDGKDLYAVMGSNVYHNNYEDNLEHYPDGSTFVEGKKRRTAMKSVLLGIMYGMGAGALAERIGETKEEAQNIIDNFYKGFPQVKKWIDDGEAQVKSVGYVEDIWGRRRRLTDATLPEWTAEVKNNESFNPLLGVSVSNKPNKLAEEYIAKAKQCKWKKESDAIKKEAESKGIILHNNSGFISRAMRQCTNARIQGSASSMTKKAMINIYHDKELKDLGFDLLLSVHDELIGQCPEENADKVAERLSWLMANCVPELNMPFKCDAEIEKKWYYNVYEAFIKEEYEKLLKDHSAEEALNIIINNHIECTEEEIKKFIF